MTETHFPFAKPSKKKAEGSVLCIEVLVLHALTSPNTLTASFWKSSPWCLNTLNGICSASTMSSIWGLAPRHDLSLWNNGACRCHSCSQLKWVLVGSIKSTRRPNRRQKILADSNQPLRTQQLISSLAGSWETDVNWQDSDPSWTSQTSPHFSKACSFSVATFERWDLRLFGCTSKSVLDKNCRTLLEWAVMMGKQWNN